MRSVRNACAEGITFFDLQLRDDEELSRKLVILEKVQAGMIRGNSESDAGFVVLFELLGLSFFFNCGLHDGGTMDITKIASELEGISKTGVTNFLELFEQTHLVYRLKPYGYGKEVLRGKSKYYLADPALSGSVLLLGKRLLQRPEKLGAAVEAAFFKHLFTRYYQQSIGFSYWQNRKGKDTRPWIRHYPAQR